MSGENSLSSKPPRRGHLAFFIVVALGLVISYLAFREFETAKLESQSQQLQHLRTLENQRIDAEVARKRSLLNYINRFFAASQRVDAQEFKKFAEFGIEQFGLLGICWSGFETHEVFRIETQRPVCNYLDPLEPNQLLSNGSLIKLSQYTVSGGGQEGYISIFFSLGTLVPESTDSSLQYYFVIINEIKNQLNLLQVQDGIVKPVDGMLPENELSHTHRVFYFNGFQLLFLSRSASPIARFSSIEIVFLASIIVLFFMIGLYLFTQIEQKQKIAMEVEAKTLELSETNKSLLVAKQIAEEANRLKSMFLANMSHEIRTPLNGIIGLVTLLEDDIRNPQHKQTIQTIISSCDTLLTVINDILEVSKLGERKVELEHRPFDLIATLNEMVKLYGFVAEKSNLKFQLNIPKGFQELWIESDEARLKQILGNLISNGIKFTPQGQISLSLRVDENSPGSNLQRTIHLEVEDTGIGLSPEDQRKLFQPFSQVDVSTTRVYGGTGLGLSICKMLVELFGGSIEVNSTIEQGSTFTVTVTVDLASRPTAVTPIDMKPTTEKTNEPSLSHSQLQVLVVDDNDTNLAVACGFLKKLFNIEPDTAKDGLQAVEACQDKIYDLILMDCHMPNMDGFEATKKIRLESRHNQKSLIVALTASVMAEDIEKIKASGMNDVMGKPLKKTILNDLIGQYFPISNVS
ncbi:ATP-binding protein [Pseudobacteriovorax antillogorgiicola]|uniref:histidine kinase n=1 Tax=Pseudobacteriovorax antillogorgiicola TaxID=1513793 RepID=A0A1Y6CQB4_9BACT|nr:ATP-binding protein [Pseudobacteriovorax antillogorgiicola]TCS42854.1 signal transduction histidine kinase [Pseudobacteriovorax antillogorgiicola]SMF81877.1 Signal transduction histidine kinase [Pseudobacteriovorax antillogorgiicola]